MVFQGIENQMAGPNGHGEVASGLTWEGGGTDQAVSHTWEIAQAGGAGGSWDDGQDSYSPLVAGVGLAPGANGQLQAASDAAKNYGKIIKESNRVLRGVPGETPNAMKLSPLRQLIKDALEVAAGTIADVISDMEIVVVPPVPSILLRSNGGHGDPDDCHCF